MAILFDAVPQFPGTPTHMAGITGERIPNLKRHAHGPVSSTLSQKEGESAFPGREEVTGQWRPLAKAPLSRTGLVVVE
jgi:hypothetical protein